MNNNSPEESGEESDSQIITRSHINRVAHGSGASDLTGSSSEMDPEMEDFTPTANALESNVQFPSRQIQIQQKKSISHVIPLMMNI